MIIHDPVFHPASFDPRAPVLMGYKNTLMTPDLWFSRHFTSSTSPGRITGTEEKGVSYAKGITSYTHGTITTEYP
eukprot:scaffold222103_cov58-Attheya_sp.AAC.1